MAGLLVLSRTYKKGASKKVKQVLQKHSQK